MKKTLVIGASEKAERYSNKAIRALRSHGHPVVAIAPREGKVEDVIFETEQVEFEGVNTVTLYIGAPIQQKYADYLVKLKPKRVIFNPGTENGELEQELNNSGIYTERACTLVLLSVGSY
ncbi:CoA-binding protein [Sunxiuqinia sp. A32]|uniref:CoA-binding protein n=1 Tax=Sunxiuqinia sp. A32 TaxID=3461496 RepID=UPI00404672AD